MTDIEINQLPAVSTIATTDVLPLDQIDATRGLSMAQLDVRYAGAASSIPFAFGDASPKPLLTVPAGSRVLTVRLIVDTAFDGAGAALAIGDADPDRVMGAAENDPAQPGAYSTTPGVKYGADTPLLLTITPGAGASQGAGAVIVTTDP